VYYRLATDDTYTIDEVTEMLNSLESVVRAEIESELIFTAHTNVLLINQILQQAQKQQVDVDVDVFKLEDRCPGPPVIIIFELTRLILAHFVRRGTTFSRGVGKN